jgi:hypothetical protein
MANYGTVLGYRAYHLERGASVGSVTDSQILEALLVASEWIDSKYRSLFEGTKVGMRSQVREWPRVSAFDYYGYTIESATVPIEIENATYEVALIHLTGTFSLSVNWTPAQYRSVSIDGAISLEYADFSSSSEIQTQFKKVDEILSLLICKQNGISSGLSGAAIRA